MATTKPNLYLSFDIESDGNNPMLNNMISIGFYGLDDNLTKIFEFEANIEKLEGHESDPECMTTFWNLPENQGAWDYLQQNKKKYIDVMAELSWHFKTLSETYKLIFVAHPSAFDWMYFKCYYELARQNLIQKDPSLKMHNIGYSCECSSTLWNLYKRQNNLSSNAASKVYKEISEVDESKEHIAIEDARCQGIAYVKLRNNLLNVVSI